jgi:hypothetical protein
MASQGRLLTKANCPFRVGRRQCGGTSWHFRSPPCARQWATSRERRSWSLLPLSDVQREDVLAIAHVEGRSRQGWRGPRHARQERGPRLHVQALRRRPGQPLVTQAAVNRAILSQICRPAPARRFSRCAVAASRGGQNPLASGRDKRAYRRCRSHPRTPHQSSSRSAHTAATATSHETGRSAARSGPRPRFSRKAGLFKCVREPGARESDADRAGVAAARECPRGAPAPRS